MSVQALAWVLEYETTTTGADRLVLIALANHAGWNNDRWECWPSRETIAREANVTRIETVKASLGRLEKAGLIRRIVNGAPDTRIPAGYRPNLYVLDLPTGGTRYDPAGGTRDAWEGGRGARDRGDASRVTGGTRDVPLTVSEPLEEPSLNRARADGAFDAFWAVYPRRTGKGAARTAFAKALAKVDLDALLDGAKRFALDPNRDEAFTPHPATWLNQERWGDDPLPRRTSGKRGSVDWARSRLEQLNGQEHTNGDNGDDHQGARQAQRALPRGQVGH